MINILMLFSLKVSFRDKIFMNLLTFQESLILAVVFVQAMSLFCNMLSFVKVGMSLSNECSLYLQKTTKVGLH